MIQRSPTWVVSLRREDRLAILMNRLLPQRWAYRITRWRNTPNYLPDRKLLRRAAEQSDSLSYG